jgi:tetratricopeptide (TPR) repeat protein
MAHDVARPRRRGKHLSHGRGFIQHCAFPAGLLAKYADAIIKVDKTSKRQDAALRIYDDILRHTPGNEDVRLKAAELAVEMGGSYFPIARRHLSNLLRSRKDDGKLEFLMGRCYEQEQTPRTLKSYQAAIEHGAPQRLDACQRRALLRDPLGQPKAADHVIEGDGPVRPENYRAYLERGRYRRRFGLPGAGRLQKALQQVSSSRRST